MFNAFLKIARDGRVIVAVPQAEIGQGVTTSLPQILADELGADWRTVSVEPAPISPLYANRPAGRGSLRRKRLPGCARRRHLGRPPVCGAQRADADGRLDLGPRFRGAASRGRRGGPGPAQQGGRRALERRLGRCRHAHGLRLARRRPDSIRRAGRSRRPARACPKTCRSAAASRTGSLGHSLPRLDLPLQVDGTGRLCRRHPPARNGLCRGAQRAAGEPPAGDRPPGGGRGSGRPHNHRESRLDRRRRHQLVGRFPRARCAASALSSCRKGCLPAPGSAPPWRRR